MKKTYGILLLVFVTLAAQAQDPQFSQFYAAPIYISPSFAGSTGATRVGLNFRNQWPAIAKGYNTYQASFDKQLDQYSSGIGFLLHRDQAGTGSLRTLDMAFVYSYSFQLNDKIVMRPGIKASFVQRSLDFNALTFGDQLRFGDNLSTSAETLMAEKTTYFDASASLLSYTQDMWVGLTVDHLPRPNQSFTGAESRVPVKVSLFAGLRRQLKNIMKDKNKDDMAFSFLYKSQGEYDQIDVGTYFHAKPLMFGAWYRGIPFLKSYQNGYANNDAIVFMLGYKMPVFHVAYSYDFTISKAFPATGGAHEISLIYVFDIQGKEKMRNVPCPTFDNSFGY